MQWSVRINEAYQRLKDPLKRAAYLCELGGAPINAHSNTAMPAQFLMQQMQWREALDGTGSGDDLTSLTNEVQAAQKQLLQECAALLDDAQDYAGAAVAVRALMFIDKFALDLHQRTDQLE